MPGSEPTTSDLVGAYRPLLGRALDALAWRPMRGDTPDLVAGLGNATLEFTRAVSLYFGEAELMLTWFNGPGGDYYLFACDLDDWSPFSLDLVHAGGDELWHELLGARLEEVAFYTHYTMPGQCVAVRHVFALADRSIEMWLGVGLNGRMESCDDLLARIGAPPDNFGELEMLETLHAE